MRARDRAAQQCLQVTFPLRNAAPARAIQIIAIAQTAVRRGSAGSVFVNIVERQSRIEAGAPAEIDAFAQPAAGFHPAANQSEVRTAAQLQPFVFLPGVAILVGLEERGSHRRTRELLPNKIAHALNDLRALALMKKRVISRRENVHAFVRRREAVEEFTLRLETHHPIAAG